MGSCALGSCPCESAPFRRFRGGRAPSPRSAGSPFPGVSSAFGGRARPVPAGSAAPAGSGSPTRSLRPSPRASGPGPDRPRDHPPRAGRHPRPASRRRGHRAGPLRPRGLPRGGNSGLESLGARRVGLWVCRPMSFSNASDGSGGIREAVQTLPCGLEAELAAAGRRFDAFPSPAPGFAPLLRSARQPGVLPSSEQWAQAVDRGCGRASVEPARLVDGTVSRHEPGRAGPEPTRTRASLGRARFGESPARPRCLRRPSGRRPLGSRIEGPAARPRSRHEGRASPRGPAGIRGHRLLHRNSRPGPRRTGAAPRGRRAV